VLEWTPSGRGLSRSKCVLCPSERWSPDKRPAERTQRSAPPPRDCRVHSNGSLRLDAQRLRNSEFDGTTAHSVRFTSCGPEGAQEGRRGFRDSGTPGQPSPTRPEPRQGFQRARHHALLLVTCPPHQTATGRQYDRFPTCRPKSHRPVESTVDRPRTPQGAHITGAATPNPRTHTHPAERVPNQRRGSADLRVYSPLSLLYSLGPRPPDLRVRPLLIHPQRPAPLGRERVGTANASSGHGLRGYSMTEADEPRNMARHRNDEGLNRS
jgi:hypothetical protein